MTHSGASIAFLVTLSNTRTSLVSKKSTRRIGNFDPTCAHRKFERPHHSELTEHVRISRVGCQVILAIFEVVDLASNL